MIEKPMALRKLDAENIIFKALQVNKRVFAVMQNRYSPPSIWVKDLIDSGKLGKIYMIGPGLFAFSFALAIKPELGMLLDMPEYDDPEAQDLLNRQIGERVYELRSYEMDLDRRLGTILAGEVRKLLEEYANHDEN